MVWLGTAGCEPASAQERPDQRLTGGSSRAWIAQRLIRPERPGPACTSGEIYTFATTHDHTVSRCQEGRIVQSHLAWSLSEASGIGPVLTINGTGTFLLSFSDPAPGLHLVRLHPMNEAQPTDKVLSLDED